MTDTPAIPATPTPPGDWLTGVDVDYEQEYEDETEYVLGQ